MALAVAVETRSPQSSGGAHDDRKWVYNAAVDILGVVVPAGTSPSIVSKLNAAMND